LNWHFKQDSCSLILTINRQMIRPAWHRQGLLCFPADYQGGDQMRFRIWTGRDTLASINGRELDSFESFSAWLASQPDGTLEVWAGRWWTVSKEARPFTLTNGRMICRYQPYMGKLAADPADYPGFFEFEAWKRAGQITQMYDGAQRLAGAV
jgi:hypothetical protein